MPVHKLTHRYVESVKSEASRLEIRDRDVRGLELRVTKAGAKSWAFRYRRQSDGAKRNVTLGSFPDYSLEDARQWAHDLRSAIARGADPAAAVQHRKEAETFRELAAEWLERHAAPNKRERTVRGDKAMLELHVFPEIGDMKAAEITKRDLIRLLDKVAAKADARNSVSGEARKLTRQPNRVFELVRSIFRWGLGRDVLKVDPTVGVKPPIKKEKPRERDLSPAEIRQLWAALERTPVRRRSTAGVARGERAVGASDIPMTRPLALALKLALVTAQRIGEVAGIAMSELDLNDTAPVWTVPGDRAKNGEPNRVPLSPLALQVIAEARELAGESAAWLFPSAAGAGPIDPHAPTKALMRAREAIGIEDFRVHDLRRTAATRMAEMGISPHTISLVLNHVSARKGTVTGKVYVQYSYDREKREALGAWSARLERIVAGADVGAVTVLPVRGGPEASLIAARI